MLIILPWVPACRVMPNLFSAFSPFLESRTPEDTLRLLHRGMCSMQEKLIFCVCRRIRFEHAQSMRKIVDQAKGKHITSHLGLHETAVGKVGRVDSEVAQRQRRRRAGYTLIYLHIHVAHIILIYPPAHHANLLNSPAALFHISLAGIS
jgi:hypothetical protein